MKEKDEQEMTEDEKIFEVNLGFEDYVCEVSAKNEEEAVDLAFKRLEEEGFQPTAFFTDISEIARDTEGFD